MISRILEIKIRQKIGTGKAIILIGPRQVGKTTLLRKLVEEQGNFLFLDGNDAQVRN